MAGRIAACLRVVWGRSGPGDPVLATGRLLRLDINDYGEGGASDVSPTESLPEIDSHTTQFLNDPNAILGEGPSRIRLGRGLSGLEVFNYGTVRELFRDPRLSPRSPQYYLDKGLTGGPILDYLVNGNLSLTWSDTHDRLRPILVKGFTPKRVEQSRLHMRTLAHQLIDGLADSDHANFVAEFSHHFSIGVIAQFIGIPPDDVGEFENATVELRLLGQKDFWAGVPRLEKALATVRDYSQRIVAQRRGNAENDLISDLIDLQRSQGEARISEVEIVWNVAGILLAGHDTTRYQVASCVRAVLEANQWANLRNDPRQIPAAINESMRLYPATPRQIRVAQQPMPIEDQPMQPGDVVTLNLAAAGRDPAFFSTPNRMALTRPNPLYDIGFGYGSHYCLGFAVAKAEMEEALLALTHRLDDTTLDGDVILDPKGVIAGPEVVPISYRASRHRANA